MLLPFINHLIQRELQTLRRELLAFADEKDIWTTPPGIENAAGTLVLHLVGNLRHYIGARLGQSDYVRNREAEFSDRDIPRSQLLTLIDRATTEVESTLNVLHEDALDTTYPETIGGFNVQTREMLLQIIVHLSYHLGQVDYHRRLVTGKNETVGAMAISELKTAVK